MAYNEKVTRGASDRAAQVLPPAGATAPPSLRESSSRVSNLPACCALGHGSRSRGSLFIFRSSPAVAHRRRRPATSLQSHRPSNTRSSRTDRGAQVLPPARATVPPSLRESSSRVSNLPACCALGPPACAAPCSCHHEPCSARSAWPHPGKACPPV